MNKIEVSHPANPLQQNHIIVAQLPAFPTHRPPEDSPRLDSHWQLRVILVHDQLLDAGKGRSLEPEVTLASGLDNEVLVAIPADTEHNLALLISDSLAYQEVAVVV